MFRKSWIISGLLAALIIAAHRVLVGLPDRFPLPPASALLRYVPTAGDGRWGKLALAGWWRLDSPDPRLGGLSALAIDADGLVAVSDSGTAIRLPKPGAGERAAFVDLPSGPGSAFKKAGRDAESLARDPSGRGWWVGFENGHELRLFDPQFGKTLAVASLRSLGWRRNRGAEALVAKQDALIVIPEDGDEQVRVAGGAISATRLDGGLARLGDAAVLPDGRWIALVRAITPLGVRSKLMVANDQGREWRTLAHLPLGRFANPEGIAAEPIKEGRVRLWLVTDNDFRRRVPTELIALDWKP